MQVEYGKAGTPDPRLYPKAEAVKPKKPAAKKKAAGKKG